MDNTKNSTEKKPVRQSGEMTPEKRRAIIARKKKRARQRKVKKQMFFVALLLILIVTGIVVGIVLSHKSEKKTKEDTKTEQKEAELVINTKALQQEEILHLSFPALISVPELAFEQKDPNVSETLAQKYLTVKEFEGILQQLYENGYMLIRMHDLANAEEVQIPKEKKPLILSQQNVNYDLRLNGKGFASRLIVGEDGKIINERVRTDGSVETGNMDVIPCVEEFVRKHPDFSYNGAKGVIGLTGYQGILGYRTAPFFAQVEENPFVSQFGIFDIEQEKQQVQPVIQALKDSGWEFACNGYSGSSYNTDAEQVREDIKLWKEQVEPLTGPVDILLYPQGNDLNTRQTYRDEDERYQCLKEAGILFYCGLDRAGSWVKKDGDTVRVNYQLLDGYRMQKDLYQQAGYFQEILDFSMIYDQTRPGGEKAKKVEEDLEENQEESQEDEESNQG